MKRLPYLIGPAESADAFLEWSRRVAKPVPAPKRKKKRKPGPKRKLRRGTGGGFHG